MDDNSTAKVLVGGIIFLEILTEVTRLLLYT